MKRLAAEMVQGAASMTPRIRYGRFADVLPDGGRKSTRQIVEPDVTHCGYTSRVPSGETAAASSGVSVAVVNRVGRALPLTGTRTT